MRTGYTDAQGGSPSSSWASCWSPPSPSAGTVAYGALAFGLAATAGAVALTVWGVRRR